MGKESFMLVSLREDKAKKLAQTISNESCRKILEYLSNKKDATESAIANDLSIPISTVHYNLQHLIHNKLVIVDEFHYSEKGKEVNHYKLANKLIIIAPAETSEKFLDKLRKIIPALGIVILASAAISFVSGMFGNAILKTTTFVASKEAVPDAGNMMIRTTSDNAIQKSAEMMAAPIANETVLRTTEQVIAAPWWQNIGLWFFIGACFGILVYYLVERFRKKEI